MVKKGITSPAQLKGQKLATPSLGNTQDVALRYWLKQNHLTSTQTGGGDVPITPITPNSAAVLQFKSGQIAGGWEPAPYDIEMVQDGGHVLVDEASLWPKGQFVTTNLVVTQKFLADHASAVNGLLKGQIQANNYIHSNPSGAEAAANKELTSLLGKGLDPSVLSAAFKQITFTNDPIASSLAARRTACGLRRPADAGQEHLSPLRSRPAERSAQGRRPAAGEVMNVLQRYRPDPGSTAQLNGRRPGQPAGDAAVRLTDVTKVYGRGPGAVHAVDRLSLTVEQRRVRLPRRRVGLR